MSFTWAIIVEPYTNVSESEINQISFYLKHISGVKILGNFSASEIDGPWEPEFIVHQNEPVISITFVEFCLRLYVYCDISWRWARAIGRETVYYMRRPLRINYLLMAGRKPIFSKAVCHIWPWNSQPWLFYITFLYLFSITLYLLSNIYYLSLLSIIYCLLSIIYCLLSIYPSSII